MSYEYHGLKIEWLGHDGFLLSKKKNIVIDPYKLKKNIEADILLITHDHFDHLSLDDVKIVTTPNTVIVTTKSCVAQLSEIEIKEIIITSPGDKIKVEGTTIEVFPAYNTNKFNGDGKLFHPRESGGVGFIIEEEGNRIYHSGDTDIIPEMKNIKADVALLPVSGTYVMTAQEAANALKEINVKIAIPMHYGTIVGNNEDALKFREISDYQIEILEKK